MKNKLRKVANILAAFVVMIAPVAADSCRAVFYEEKEPEGFQEFAKAQNK